MKLLYVGLKPWFEGTIEVWKKELYRARQIYNEVETIISDSVTRKKIARRGDFVLGI